MDYLLGRLTRLKAIAGFDVITPPTADSIGRVLVWVEATIADSKLAELREDVKARVAETGVAWDVEVVVRLDHLRILPPNGILPG